MTEELSQTDKIKFHNFLRPDKFSKEHIQYLHNIHESFARQATNGMSAQLRALVEFKVASIDLLTFEEFARILPNPTTIAVVGMYPLHGSMIIEISPSITFTIIDRLFGGYGECLDINREISDIEMSVMEGILVRLLGNLQEAWSTVIDLRPKLICIETNPQCISIAPFNETSLFIAIESKIVDVEGMINLCIPYTTVEPILNRLTYQYESRQKFQNSPDEELISEKLLEKNFPIHVYRKFNLDTIWYKDGFKKGDVLSIDTETKISTLFNIVDSDKG
jgi:flagellar motor switch protein FliM